MQEMSSDDWTKVLSSSRVEGFRQRIDPNSGFRIEGLEKEFKDEYGVVECKASSSENSNFIKAGRILSLVTSLCDGRLKTVRINEALRQGSDIFIRSKRANPNTLEEAKKQERRQLDASEYRWNGQRRHRERIKSDDADAYFWTQWYNVMSPREIDQYWQTRYTNTGYWTTKIAQYFREDTFGVIELQIIYEETDKADVKYVGVGEILPLILALCFTGLEIWAQIDRALKDGYGVSFRCLYLPTLGQAKDLYKYLLEEFDYAWNISRREVCDPDGDWSDWEVLPTQDIPRFNDRSGAYEILKTKATGVGTTGKSGKVEEETIVYVGSVNIRKETEILCTSTSSKYISKYINAARESGYTIYVRYLYVDPDDHEKAKEKEDELLQRYDYPWVRKMREDVEDSPHEWSDWVKILQPYQEPVEAGWTYRNKQCPDEGLMLQEQELLSRFPDKHTVFEVAFKRKDGITIIADVMEGNVGHTIKDYCMFYKGKPYKRYCLSEILAKKRCTGIFARYAETVNDANDAAELMKQLLQRYDYKWNRSYREEINDSKILRRHVRWSDWKKVCRPDIPEPEELSFWKRRGVGKTGYRLKTEEQREEIENKGGIYELSAKKGETNVVLYVGMSEEQLGNRIIRHFQKNQHLDDYIEKALRLEFDICIRYVYTTEAEQMEKELLYRYNYARNGTRNDGKRDILS